ncbi:TPA: hypothetical protein I7665_09095 [Vibrio vulnificus]|uniref:Uncharacterized protein n=1 Tax=Vibrio vulnificus TaxID=672 RepID=A0ABX4WZE5_VIBVL|nr:hypothetical protein AOT11_09405 [Vibrio vulnificus NBRC 15645 = ATCC 27562]AUL95059.1 hypothetical protein FORC54_0914 [Vibrio vulnificus]OZT82809.1 hypothetical protein CIK04_21470 [Vibrio sp. 03_296]EGQ7693917.1 hypothetical protein [Vibrio vulnificus]EGQ7833669.1 hypothetical protein [Vibrio vulnificus]
MAQITLFTPIIVTMATRKASLLRTGSNEKTFQTISNDLTYRTAAISNDSASPRDKKIPLIEMNGTCDD